MTRSHVAVQNGGSGMQACIPSFHFTFLHNILVFRNMMIFWEGTCLLPVRVCVPSNELEPASQLGSHGMRGGVGAMQF